MRLRSRITIGTLGFLLISLTLCCTLMIYVSKKNMLNSTTSYTKTELEKLVANFYTNKSDIESTVEELTAETKLKYYFFKQTQYSDSDTEYVLQCGDEIIYNDSGLDAPTILGLNEDKSNVEIQGRRKATSCIQKGQTITYAEWISISMTESIVCIVRDITELYRQIYRMIALCVGIGIVISLAAAVSMIAFLKKLLRPLEQLKDEADAISQGSISVR